MLSPVGTLHFKGLLEQRWAIYAVFYDKHGKQNQYKHLYLEEEQWNLIEEMVKVLKPFADCYDCPL